MNRHVYYWALLTLFAAAMAIAGAPFLISGPTMMWLFWVYIDGVTHPATS